jgi:hypothetical protein
MVSFQLHLSHGLALGVPCLQLMRLPHTAQSAFQRAIVKSRTCSLGTSSNHSFGTGLPQNDRSLTIFVQTTHLLAFFHTMEQPSTTTDASIHGGTAATAVSKMETPRPKWVTSKGTSHLLPPVHPATPTQFTTSTDNGTVAATISNVEILPPSVSSHGPPRLASTPLQRNSSPPAAAFAVPSGLTLCTTSSATTSEPATAVSEMGNFDSVPSNGEPHPLPPYPSTPTRFTNMEPLSVSMYGTAYAALRGIVPTQLTSTVNSATVSNEGFWSESVKSERAHGLSPYPFMAPVPSTPNRFTLVPTDASVYGTAAAAVSNVGVWPELHSPHPSIDPVPSTPTGPTVPRDPSIYGTAAAAVSEVGVWPESVPSGHPIGGMSHRKTVTGSPASLQLAILNNNQADPSEYYAAITEPLKNDWKLYPHQERAVLTALRTKRHILALAMGSGKTLIGCVWARQMRNTLSTRKRKCMAEDPTKIKIIVLCPVSLQPEWRRTAQVATGLTIQEKSAPIDSETAVAIVSWAKVPYISDVGDQDYVVVADEAHFMQNSYSKRTEKAPSCFHCSKRSDIHWAKTKQSLKTCFVAEALPRSKASLGG